jgi:hypothetical protein
MLPFVVRLPLRPGAEIVVAPEPPDPASDGLELEGCRVFVVDHDDTREILAAILGDALSRASSRRGLPAPRPSR